MNSTPIDALIFDCDGTLVDSEPIAFEVMLDQARRFGVMLTQDEAIAELKGQSMSRCLERLGEHAGRPLPDDFVIGLRAAMAEAFRERLLPMDDALVTLQGLRVPFCVASNGPREKLELTLSLTGLLPVLEGRIFSAFEVGSWKPDPGLFLHAARVLGVAPERCAVVEDSVSGVQAALAAGMTVYVLSSEQDLPPDLAARVRMLAKLTELLAEPWNAAP